MCEYPFQGHKASLSVRSPCLFLVLSGSCWQQAGRAASSTLSLVAQGYVGASTVHPGHCPMVMMARAWEALQKGDSPGQSPSEHLDSDLILNPKEVSVHISPFQTPLRTTFWGSL